MRRFSGCFVELFSLLLSSLSWDRASKVSEHEKRIRQGQRNTTDHLLWAPTHSVGFGKMEKSVEYPKFLLPQAQPRRWQVWTQPRAKGPPKQMIRRSRCSQQLGTFFFIEEIGRNHGHVRLPEGTLFMKTNPKLKPRPTWIPVFFVGSVRSGRHFPRDSAGALRERASTSAWQASQDLAGDEVALLCLDLRVRWTRLIYIVIAYFSSRFSLFGVYPPINQPGFTNGGVDITPKYHGWWSFPTWTWQF